MCGTTTTAAYIQHCSTNRPLTMSVEPRRSEVSTKPREDPGAREVGGGRAAPLARRSLALSGLEQDGIESMLQGSSMSQQAIVEGGCTNPRIPSGVNREPEIEQTVLVVVLLAASFL